ncbi:hypothetical protein GCM10010172_63160 [Paractinoplanes ferrugineus]|uniref:Uncharacterized protein n=1 Tax=Paractinoplanes ferrugineus TaxID=113564 RepID=A0A919J8V3_9ACTN|nr:hypothetical protein Afe05nite_66540 [Actinoplanes ferrugineus]
MNIPDVYDAGVMLAGEDEDRRTWGIHHRPMGKETAKAAGNLGGKAGTRDVVDAGAPRHGGALGAVIELGPVPRQADIIATPGRSGQSNGWASDATR